MNHEKTFLEIQDLTDMMNPEVLGTVPDMQGPLQSQPKITDGDVSTGRNQSHWSLHTTA